MKHKRKCHATDYTFRNACGSNGSITTIVNWRMDDPLAKLITCKRCRRIWKRRSSTSSEAPK